MQVFLLVVILLNGDVKVGMEAIPPPATCETVKAQVIEMLELNNAKVIKAECLTIAGI
jgi:hypothetical protein